MNPENICEFIPNFSWCYHRFYAHVHHARRNHVLRLYSLLGILSALFIEQIL